MEAFPELLVLRLTRFKRIDKHAVMLALNLFQRVPEGLQEILVRVPDRPVHVELDRRLGARDCGNLCGEVLIGGFELLLFADLFPVDNLRPGIRRSDLGSR